MIRDESEGRGSNPPNFTPVQFFAPRNPTISEDSEGATQQKNSLPVSGLSTLLVHACAGFLLVHKLQKFLYDDFLC